MVIGCQFEIAAFVGLIFARLYQPCIAELEMNNRSKVRFASALGAALCMFAAISGCGSKVPFDFVPVHGKVTYEDGSRIPADSMVVTFNPIVQEKSKMSPPGGQTQVNVQDGTFSAVSSHRANDGVAVGRHKVVVMAFEKGPGGSSVPSSAVPLTYRNESTTPLEIEVDTADQFLDLKVRRK
jgi:predicted small lipoprotein YifL